MTQADEFAVIIPCLNARKTLEPCLRAVLQAAASVGQVEVIVADNGSTDGSVGFIRDRFAEAVTVIEHPGLTIGALRNAGALPVQARTLCFIDADCVVTADWFLQVRRVLLRTGASGVGCYYSLPQDPSPFEVAWDRLHYPAQDGPVLMINGGNFAITREAFVALGGFDEILITGEDAEFCQRLTSRGYLLWQDRSIAAEHLGNPRTLSGFYRKQRWHALGALGTVRAGTVDRPFAMTIAFLATSLAGLAVLAWPPLTATRALGGIALLVICPFATVVYRAVTLRRRPPLVRGLALYWLYYAARSAALPSALHYRRTSDTQSITSTTR